MFLMSHSQDWEKLNICVLVSQIPEDAHDNKTNLPVITQAVQTEDSFKPASNVIYPEFYEIDIKQQVRSWLFRNSVTIMSFLCDNKNFIKITHT